MCVSLSLLNFFTFLLEISIQQVQLQCSGSNDVVQVMTKVGVNKPGNLWKAVSLHQVCTQMAHMEMSMLNSLCKSAVVYFRWLQYPVFWESFGLLCAQSSIENFLGICGCAEFAGSLAKHFAKYCSSPWEWSAACPEMVIPAWRSIPR